MNTVEVAGIVGIFLGLVTLRYTAIQIRNAAQQFTEEQRRARLQSALDFIAVTLERRHKLSDLVPHERDATAVAEFLSRLPDDVHALRNLNRYLSYYESLAVGVNMGIIDGEVLRRAWGSTIIRAYDTYREFIEKRRQDLDQPDLYRELEDLRSWLCRRRTEERRPPRERAATSEQRQAVQSAAAK